MPAEIRNIRRPSDPRVRVRVVVRGAVQGVGFRPFVHRLATELGLAGWVNNSPQGVFLEVESERPALENFLRRLESEKPPLASIQSLEATWLDAAGFKNFEIRPSDAGGGKTALVLPDIATCADCRREIFDPKNRRFRYPFTNCTNCGPRFSIVEALPYDRANTSMRKFAMCPACQAEYDDPEDRRFHAQPNACPVCGPHLEIRKADFGETGPPNPGSDRSQQALLAAADALRAGRIVAVKGIGGFHLMADARNDDAVRRLRERKHREEKPFALLFPTLESARQLCEISPLEERLLLAPEAPIVLLARKPESAIGNRQSAISPLVGPRNPNLGLMLPSNPLHHLLMAELGFPVVATSGNLSDEPICTDELEAADRLRGIADAFLIHNRPIVRHVDDSIVRVVLDREMVLRRARGYAPLPVPVPAACIEPASGAGVLARSFQPHRVHGHWASPEDAGTPPEPERRSPIHRVSKWDSNGPGRRPALHSILAVGAHLKNAVALAVGGNAFISQHIGDLETPEAEKAFRRVAADLQALYEVKADVIAADLHPDYLSTQYAIEQCSPAGSQAGTPRIMQIQHHVAHALSCIAENEIALPALAVAWDGTGYGADGTIWGGEFFVVRPESVERVACLRPFRLPGGDAAIKEPRRAALGLLFEMGGDGMLDQHDCPAIAAFSAAELPPLMTMLNRGLNSPKTSSIGRLFDAVTALIGLRQRMRFEGQAAMELEFAAAGVNAEKGYELPLLSRDGICHLDWEPAVREILSDAQKRVAIGEISAKFHNTLAEAIVAAARHFGQARVAFSGGCFQNRRLLERTVNRLRAEKFQPYWHQRVPTNDGGIALGQILAAVRADEGMKS